MALKKYRQSLIEAARVYADPDKDFNDYLDTLGEVKVQNPYAGTSREQLTKLYLAVQAGTSNLSPKKRQQILDEWDRRAEG